jgi:hypothetical protein
MVRLIFPNHLFPNISDFYFLPCAATVFKADPLDHASGKHYRDKILLPGGSREEIDILKVRLTTSESLWYDYIDLNIK